LDLGFGVGVESPDEGGKLGGVAEPSDVDTGAGVSTKMIGVDVSHGHTGEVKYAMGVDRWSWAPP
jgi:hypothetical protein